MISIGFAIGLGIALLLTTGLLLWSFVEYARLDRENKQLARELLRMEPLFAQHPEDRDFAALGRVADRCYRTARDKGWWDGFTVTSDGGLPNASPITTALELNADQLAARLCLIHSEVSEALEDVRMGSPLDVSTVSPVDGKPIGFPSELADVVIRVFDLTSHMGINIGQEMAKKMTFNTTRPHRHGGKAL